MAHENDSPRERSVDLHYGHPRMPLSERAKIFSPFDTLKGFRAALAEQERKVLEGFQDSEPDDTGEWE